MPIIKITTGKQLDDFISNRVDLLIPEVNVTTLVETTPTLIGVAFNPIYIQALTRRAKYSLRQYIETEMLKQLDLSAEILFEYAEIVRTKI